MTDLERFTQLMHDFSVDYGVLGGPTVNIHKVVVRTEEEQHWYFNGDGIFLWVE